MEQELQQFTTFQASKICGVSIKTIVKWIEDGKLTAYKTLGGHRRIKREDLIEFLIKNNMPLPVKMEFSRKRRSA